MANRDILAIGTSAGGFNALRSLARELPGNMPAAVLMVIHLPAQFPSELDAILTQAGPLPATFARNGEAVQHSHIYVAPPAAHLLLDGDRLQLGYGPSENNARPAIDPLFRSAALCCGPRSVGVVMTGTMGDGASGLQALKRCGGMTVVQDPSDAAFPEMPSTALRRVKPDHVVGLAGMAGLLEKLARQPAGALAPVPGGLAEEVQIARDGNVDMKYMDQMGRRSVLACPECHGVLWEVEDGDLMRYRCHVGHAYTAELMSAALDENLRRAIGSALRVLDERISLTRKLVEEDSRNGRRGLAESWARKLREAEQQADVLRSSIRRVDEIAAKAAPT
jgi:two-component system chemotaxis response regulator CheB